MTQRLTAQERLAKTRARVREAIADAQQTLRAAEAAAREEARKAHRQHLWTLARLLDETGLSAYTAEELAPHLRTLAAQLREDITARANIPSAALLLRENGAREPG